MALILTENNKSLGRIQSRQVKTFTTTVRNDSQTNINIDQIKPCCSSCSSASLNKYVFGPNETGILTINYTPSSPSQVPITKCIKIIYHINGARAEATFNFSAQAT